MLPSLSLMGYFVWDSCQYYVSMYWVFCFEILKHFDFLHCDTKTFKVFQIWVRVIHTPRCRVIIWRGVWRKALKAKTHDATNRCDTLLQQIASCDVKIIVAAICRKNSTYRSDKISASSFLALCTHLRQNLNQPMRKRQLLSRHVKFELVYISSIPKSVTCTEQVPYRSDLWQDQCRRGNLSPRCVAAICRIVCLGL